MAALAPSGNASGTARLCAGTLSSSARLELEPAPRLGARDDADGRTHAPWGGVGERHGALRRQHALKWRAAPRARTTALAARKTAQRAALAPSGSASDTARLGAGMLSSSARLELKPAPHGSARETTSRWPHTRPVGRGGRAARRAYAPARSQVARGSSSSPHHGSARETTQMAAHTPSGGASDTALLGAGTLSSGARPPRARAKALRVRRHRWPHTRCNRHGRTRSVGRCERLGALRRRHALKWRAAPLARAKVMRARCCRWLCTSLVGRCVRHGALMRRHALKRGARPPPSTARAKAPDARETRAMRATRRAYTPARSQEACGPSSPRQGSARERRRWPHSPRRAVRAARRAYGAPARSQTARGPPSSPRQGSRCARNDADGRTCPVGRGKRHGALMRRHALKWRAAPPPARAKTPDARERRR